MKSVIVRLDDQLFQEFDRLCKERGYAKQGLIKRLIREIVLNSRIKSIPVEEVLPDEEESIGKQQKEVLAEEVIDWDRIKGDL